MAHTYQLSVGGKPLTIETGELAEQANGAVILRYGDSMLLVTVCAAPKVREGIDFLPLTVDYEERLYAAGKIPGSFFRREGRPSQDAILTGRLTDRPLRPLFPKGLRNEVQIVITVLSVDHENPPEMLSIIGASAALCNSDIPFGGPVGATRVGYLDGEYVINPTYAQLELSKLDLVMAGTRDAVMMVEAGASEVSEEVILEAIRRGQEVNQEIVTLEEQMAAEVGKAKMAVQQDGGLPEELTSQVNNLLNGRLEGIIDRGEAKGERNAHMRAMEQELVEKLGETYSSPQVLAAFDDQLKQVVRSKILQENQRPDGRGVTEIRPITSRVGVLPRTHGSGLFTRGQTQVLTIATLGSTSERQKLDTLSPEDSKRFLHHYNFPPFSTGEVKRLGTGRREVGHGALVERALLPLIPGEEEFPYTIRLVSECLSSNGSTSMASTCGSTLALMDAGVPIKRPVAGVAMGLIKGADDHYVILTDIQGIEDFMGDMDFKVAGTVEGITALQMDIKAKGITSQIMQQALQQAHEARLFILERMRETIDEVRHNLSPYAPRMLRITIPAGKIGTVIGPGGKTIRSLQEQNKVSINIEDDGTVTVSSVNEERARRAVELIEDMVREVEVGQVYNGKVTRLMNFGAFVEILPGKDGLVHIGELADYRVPSVEDVVKVGDELTVMVTEIDPMGRVNLSRRAVLEGATPDEVRARSRSNRPGGDNSPEGGRFARRPGGPPGDRYGGPSRERGPRP